MARVLIATLGKSPGAVTTSVDVLVRWLREEAADRLQVAPDEVAPEHYQLDRLVCLMLPAIETSVTLPNPHDSLCDSTLAGDDYQHYLERHFSRRDGETGLTYYEQHYAFTRPLQCEPLVARLPHNDLRSREDAREFLRVCLKAFEAWPACEHEVHVGIAGGRKAMSALAELAAVCMGARGGCFQAIAADAENEYTYEQLRGADEDTVLRALHPEQAHYLPVGFALEAGLQRRLHDIAVLLMRDPAEFDLRVAKGEVPRELAPHFVAETAGRDSL